MKVTRLISCGEKRTVALPAIGKMKKTLPTVIFLLGMLGSALAEPSISSSLSETVTDVDHPVRLEIKIENARITRPPTVSVNGLSISFAGTSNGTQILNFKASSITIFTYIVTPTTEGIYQIPPVEVSAGGKAYRTSPLTLKVIHGDPNRSATSDKPYFAELVIPKESAYVGEQIPIELRFYFNQRIQYQPYPQGQYPIIEGEDFVTKKYSEPTEKQLELNGRIYHVVVYKTALTGVKPGKLELQSATQGFLISTPFGSRGSTGLLDPFENFQQQVVDVKTNGSSIQINPLPVADRPADFSGAVGEFTLTSSAQPEKVNTGDPVSMKVEVRGLGNFDRMGQPALTSTDGWHIYQPTEGTETLDDIGLSATKIFSYPLVPEKPVSTLPIARFSYFNPNSGKYVTVNSAPVSIEVQGDLAPKVSIPSPTAAPAAPANAKPPSLPDVLDIQVRPPIPATFLPLIEQPIFWISQAIPACALLALGFGLWLKKVRIASQPLRELNVERRALRKKIDASNSRSDVLQAAVQLLELDCKARSIRKPGSPPSLDACLSGERLTEDVRNDLRNLIDARSARIYGHHGSESLTEEERSRIITLLNRWKAAA
jgi:hypothetical protein